MYKDAIIGSLFLVLCNYLTMLIYGGQRAAFRQGSYPEVRDPGRGPKAGRLLHHTGDTPKNTRTCPLIEGRGGAHADSPRWQEKGNSSLLCTHVSDPLPAVVQDATPLQTATQRGADALPRLRSIPSCGPGGCRSAADSRSMRSRCSSLTNSSLQQDSESTGGTASVGRIMSLAPEESSSQVRMRS